jgi:hypothetical protein
MNRIIYGLHHCISIDFRNFSAQRGGGRANGQGACGDVDARFHHDRLFWFQSAGPSDVRPLTAAFR